MKREILCPDCNYTPKKYPGEGFVKKIGILRHHVREREMPQELSPKMTEMVSKFGMEVIHLPMDKVVCDHCNAEIPPETLCICLSLYSDGVPYFEWEDEFIERISDADLAVHQKVKKRFEGPPEMPF